MSGISYPLRPFSFHDFTGGLNTRDNPATLKPNETRRILNYVFNKGKGLSSRGGQRLVGTFPSTGAPQGSWEFAATGKTPIFLGVQDGNLYSMNKSTGATTLLLSGLSASLQCDGIGLSDDFYICNHTDGVIRVFYSSGVLTAQLVADSPKIDFLTSDKEGRLYGAGDPNSPNRVYFCAFGNGTDWQTANNAGYFDVIGTNLQDGDYITSLSHVGTSLYAGRNKGVKKIDNFDPFNTNVSDFPVSFGIAGQRSMAVMDTWGFFLTPTHGVWSFNFFYPVTKSDKVESAFNSFNKGLFSKACAVQDGYMYRIALPKSGSSYNNCEMVFDTNYNAWSYFEGENIGCYISSTDGNLYATDSVNGNLYQLNYGNTDNGNPIELDYVIPKFDGQESFADKIPIWAYIYTENSAQENVSFEYIIDDQTFTSTVVSTPPASNVWGSSPGTGILSWGTNPSNPQDLWASPYLLKSKCSMQGKGRFFEFRFYSSGVTSQISILGFDIAFVFLLPN